MLPSTITVNAGSPAADIVFSSPQRSGNTVTFASDSPQGDLFGVRTLRFSSEKTSKQLERTLVQLRLPVYDDEGNKYTGEVTINCTVIRPALAPVALTAYGMEIVRELLAQSDVAAAINVARL